MSIKMTMKYYMLSIMLLFCSNTYSQSLKFRNNSRLVLGTQEAKSASIGLGDIDQDGDVDILITNRGKENEICLNDGTGKFTKTLTFGTKDDSTIDVEVADMDGDKDNDLILANRDGQQNYIYLNDGNLNFSKKVAFGTGKDETRSVAIADLNNDGNIDIVIANVGSPNKVFLNSDNAKIWEEIMLSKKKYNT